MTAYIIRRSLYALPVLFGVNVLVFLLFFFVNSPDNMARAHLGQKRVTPDQIDAWKRERLLHLPYFYNAGWRRIGSLPAAERDNTAEFPSAGAGEYALVIEAPETPRASPPRTVRLQSLPPYPRAGFEFRRSSRRVSAAMAGRPRRAHGPGR